MRKYLEFYAERTPDLDRLAGSFDFGVAIPARRETSYDLRKTLTSLSSAAAFANGKVLAVIVNNGTIASEEDLELNSALAADLLGFDQADLPKECACVEMNAQLSIVVIDRYSPKRAFSTLEGVGLARKLGADFLLRLITENRIRLPTVFYTDADAEVPQNYFAYAESSRATTLHYPFWHWSESPSEDYEALQVYEIFLRYNYFGLKYAGSRYAHHSLGSSIAVTAEAYAQVRGMPNRLAGEDFHFLNKLRKVDRVSYAKTEPIRIQSRRSNRVPFGTGAAVQKISQKSSEDYEMYDFRIYENLKILLSICDSFLEHDDKKRLTSELTQHSLLDVALEFNVPQNLERAFLTTQDLEKRLTAFHTQFDALQTLRFIHALRRNRLPSLRWRAALRQANELKHFAELPIEGLKERFFSLETSIS